MNKIIEVHNDGFRLFLDCRVYPLQAVKKALFRWMNKYYVSISLVSEDLIEVICKLKNSQEPQFISDSDKVLNDLMFESLRVEVIAQTSSIRELLVGRALYGTCIEIEPREIKDAQNDSQEESWVEDGKRILTSWNKDRSNHD